jgi:hypothetical protein
MTNDSTPLASRARTHLLPLGLFTLLLAALLAPTFQMYMWYGHERFHAVARVRELCKVWAAQGPFHAPWLPDVCFGQGWPFFTFYAPLGYYVAAAVHFLFGLDYGAATRWSFYAAFWLAGALVYGLVWHAGAWRAGARGRGWALAAAVIYTFAPYHLTDVFARVSLAESWAWAALPALFWGLELARRRPLPGALAVALAMNALVLSHNVMALYGAALAAAGTLLTARDRRWPLAVAGGGALGVALSAYFWLPALALKSLVPVKDVKFMYGSPESLRQQAVHWQQFFIEQIGKGESVEGWRDTMGINLGIAVGLALVLGVAALAWRVRAPEERRRLGAALALTAVAAFMVTPWMPWRFIPGLLRYVQFPWRLLLLTTFLGVLTLAWSAPALGRRWLHPALFIALAAGLGLAGAYRTLFKDIPRMSDAELPGWVAGEERALVFAGCQKVEYLPLTAPLYLANFKYHEDYPPPPGRLTVLEGQLTIRQYQQRGAAYTYIYDALVETLARAHVFAFPGWTLRLDEQVVGGRLETDPETGYLLLRLPAGLHTLELKYELSPVGRVARGITVAAWLALAALALRLRRQTGPTPQGEGHQGRQ